MADLMPSLVSVLDALRELRLLKPDQLSAIILQDLQGGFSDSPALGKELIQRGWLTPFQVNQLLQDKGRRCSPNWALRQCPDGEPRRSSAS